MKALYNRTLACVENPVPCIPRELIVAISWADALVLTLIFIARSIPLQVNGIPRYVIVSELWICPGV
jgi:hypothetical protein